MVYILRGTLYICTYVHRYSYACTLHVVVHLYRVDRYTRHATIHTAYGYVDTVLSLHQMVLAVSHAPVLLMYYSMLLVVLLVCPLSCLLPVYGLLYML